jgi:hypothetical protein
VDVLDVFEAKLLELRDRLTTAKATSAVNEHRLFFVE